MNTDTATRITLALEDIDASEMRGRHAGPLDPAEYESHHYRATLKRAGRSAQFRFSTGPGWARRPVAREVLEAVLSDAAAIDQAETLAEARDAIRENFGDDAGNVDAIAAGCLAADRKLRRLLADDYDAAISDPAGYVWTVTDDPPEHLTRPAAGAREWSGRIGTHRDGYPVRLHVELRNHDGHDELAISATTPYSAGQARDELAGLETYADGWDADSAAELAAIWDRWHLNGMRAYCEHQAEAGWPELAAETVTLYHWRTTRAVRDAIRAAEKEATATLRAGGTVTHPPELLELLAMPSEVTTSSDTPPNDHYEPNGPAYQGDTYNRPSETKQRGWVRPDEHPAGLLTAPCPTCGYRYGTEWKREELPDEVRQFLRARFGIA